MSTTSGIYIIEVRDELYCELEDAHNAVWSKLISRIVEQYCMTSCLSISLPFLWAKSD